MLLARNRTEFDAITAALRPYAEQVEPWLLRQQSVTGWCRACGAVSRFEVAPGQSEDSWRSLTEGMVCRCGLNGRMRLILSAVDELLASPGPRVLVLERLTPLYAPLAARLPGLIGSEYFADTPSGRTKNVGNTAVRCESMMDLSFPDASLDVVMHFDVLEHVPDWRIGLRECARVLVDGGRLLFTCPFFYTMDRNLVRAVWRDGEIHHLLPPGYHGNPVSAEGSLVFVHPSWEVFDELRPIGFEDAAIAINYQVAEGIVSNACPYPDGHVWPIAILATRGARMSASSPARRF